MLINLSKEELETVVGQLWKSRNTEEKVGEVYNKLKPLLDVCVCREQIQSDYKVSQERVGKDLDLL